MSQVAAGQADAGAEAPAEGGQEQAVAEQAPAQAGPSPEIADLVGRIDQIQQGFGQVLERLPEPQQEREQAPWEDPSLDPYEAERMRAEDERIQALVDQRLGPVQERLEEQRVDRDLQRVWQEVPDLRNPEVFNPAVQAAAQHPLNQRFQGLAGEPEFLRLVHMASRFEEVAAREGQQQQQGAEVPLEHGGGAAPALASEKDEAAAIVGAGGLPQDSIWR